MTLDELARDRLRRWLASSRLTQTELAERVGRNQAWMSRYLNCEFDADLETLQKMARVFGHSMFALLDKPAESDEERFLELYRALPMESRPVFRQVLELVRRPGQ